LIVLTAAQDLVAIFARVDRKAGTPAAGSHLRQPRVDLGATNMKNLFVRFVKDNSGATAIEYGLIAAGISVAIIAVVNGLGTNLNGKFNTISTQLK
jgi:pilus assembly protein Flp/PilA